MTSVGKQAWVLALLLLAVVAPSAARAHEVLHSVERGRALAVRAVMADGEPLAYVPYEIFSPADPNVPYQKGKTDRDGFVAFVPNAPGKWRVRVADESGHGIDLEVDAAAGAAPAASLPAAAFVLRPLAGVLIVAAIFAGLFFLHRRRGRRA